MKLARKTADYIESQTLIVFFKLDDYLSKEQFKNKIYGVWGD